MYIRLSLVTASTTELVLFWSFSHFITVWSYGSGYYPVLLAAEVGFAIWSTYDIVDLKISNAHLVAGEESIWGFGQVLPMVILSLIGLQAMDAWNQSSGVEVQKDLGPASRLENNHGASINSSQ